MEENRNIKAAILAEPLDLQSAGIYVYLRLLIENLPQQDKIEYQLIRTKEPEELYNLPNKVLSYRDNMLNLLFRKFFSLPKFIVKEDYDVVIEPAHFGPFNLPSNIKRVTIIHDLTPILFPKFHLLHSRLFHKFFLKRILRKSHLILANSHNTKADLLKYYPKIADRVQVIYPAVDKIFTPQNSREVLDNRGINNDYILSVGTIEPRKNYISLLKAFEVYKRNNPEDKRDLVIIGKKGWKTDELFSYYNRSEYKDNIIFLHDVKTEELPAFYSHCSVFVFPSHYEGFGFPLLEAYKCGAKCIAANNSSLAEIGKSFAHFYETSNHEELANVLEEAIRSDKGYPEGSNHLDEDFSMKFHNEIVKLSSSQES